METTYRVLTREVLECARAFKGRRGAFKGRRDVFRISIDYILELLARFARSPINSESKSKYLYHFIPCTETLPLSHLADDANTTTDTFLQIGKGSAYTIQTRP